MMSTRRETRSQKPALVTFNENPECLLQAARMADQNNSNNPQNEENRRQEDPQRETNEPVAEMYLPDLMNTPLSKATRNAMQMEDDSQILVECPLLREIYGVDTLLVDKASGECKLFTGLDEPEPFPLPCNKTKYPPPTY